MNLKRKTFFLSFLIFFLVYSPFHCCHFSLLGCSSVTESEHLVRPRLVCSCSLLPLQAMCSCHNKDQRGWTYTIVDFLENGKKRKNPRGLAVCKLNCSGQDKEDLSFYLHPQSHFTHFAIFSSAYVSDWTHTVRAILPSTPSSLNLSTCVLREFIMMWNCTFPKGKQYICTFTVSTAYEATFF